MITTTVHLKIDLPTSLCPWAYHHLSPISSMRLELRRIRAIILLVLRQLPAGLR